MALLCWQMVWYPEVSIRPWGRFAASGLYAAVAVVSLQKRCNLSCSLIGSMRLPVLCYLAAPPRRFLLLDRQYFPDLVRQQPRCG
jgi:hypothetical protein